MKTVRAHNPGFLTVVNPRKRGTMVRRKRRGAARRRVGSSLNPRRRRRVAAAPRRRRRTALALANPHRRRRTRRAVANPRRRRRRNPSPKSLLVGGLAVGAGGFLTNIVASYIPFGGGGWIDVLKQFAAAWIVGWAAEKVPFIGHQNAQLMAYGGFGAAAWTGANMLLSGASGFLQPQPAQPGVAGFFGDISTYPAGSGGGQLGEIVNSPEWYSDAAMRNG